MCLECVSYGSRFSSFLPGPVTPAEAVGDAVVADFYLDRFVVLLHGVRRKGTRGSRASGSNYGSGARSGLLIAVH